MNLDLNEETAYILGFTYTDGNVFKEDGKKPRITYRLRLGDRDIIENISRYLGSKYKISEKGNSVSTHIYSEELYKFMIDWGVKPNKSVTGESPLIPDGYEKSWLLGYLDGDGCVMTHKGYLYVEFLSGTRSKSVLDRIEKIIEDKLGIVGRISSSNRCYRLRYKDKDSRIIIGWLYSSSCMRGHRKYDLCKSICASQI